MATRMGWCRRPTWATRRGPAKGRRVHPPPNACGPPSPPPRMATTWRPGPGGTRSRSGRAGERADELAGRLKRRIAELALERQLVPQAPVVIAGALVVPASLLAAAEQAPRDGDLAQVATDAAAKRRTELAAMRAVLAWE